MEKISSLNLDFDRVLIQLIIPGLAAFFPWAIIFLNSHHFERDFLFKNLTLLITILSILSLIVGIILENLGSIIEVHFYDKKNGIEFPNYMDIWKEFLCLNYAGNEPTGHRYLRNILLRMKFELSFGLGLVPMAIGLIVLDSQTLIFNSIIIKILFFYFFPLASSIYLIFIEARSSSKVLARTREILVLKYGK